MPSITPPRPTTTTRVARVPYLNSAPFFRGLPLSERFEIVESVPRAVGEQAAAGTLLAGLLPLADCFRLEDSFERLGRYGIAVRGRAHSVLLLSRRPIRLLDGATIAVTADTSTTVLLMRLLLEQRYHLRPAAYTSREQSPDADALLLIGDEALRYHASNTQYPFEVDLAFEWWLWQHLPFVFAVWAIRKDATPQDKKRIEASIARALALNTPQFEQIAAEASTSLGIPAEELQTYLSSFIYRLSQPEEDGIAQFRKLVDEHHLL